MPQQIPLDSVRRDAQKLVAHMESCCPLHCAHANGEVSWQSCGPNKHWPDNNRQTRLFTRVWQVTRHSSNVIQAFLILHMAGMGKLQLIVSVLDGLDHKVFHLACIFLPPYIHVLLPFINKLKDMLHWILWIGCVLHHVESKRTYFEQWPRMIITTVSTERYLIAYWKASQIIEFHLVWHVSRCYTHTS